MPWYAVYEIATGRLHSTGTVVAGDKELAERGFAKKQLAADPQDGSWEWDAAALDFKRAPVRKAVMDTRQFLNAMTPSEREAFFEAARAGPPAQQKRTNAFLEYVKLAGAVDPNDPYIAGELAAMEAAGIFGRGKF